MSQEQREAWHRSGEPTADEHRVVVRDRRRIDPETGQVRPPDAGGEPAPGAPEPGVASASPSTGRHAAEEASAAEAVETVALVELKAQLDELKAQLDERTADLQRVSAEYANYRKRVDRDREAVVAAAKTAVVVELLTVLDDLERAEAHGDLTGAFKAVADKVVSSLQRVGLTPFGHEGEPFEPSVHEAVQHTTSPEVSGPTVTAVLRRGYRVGERVVRPALVAVTDHEPAAPAEEAAEQSPGGQR